MQLTGRILALIVTVAAQLPASGPARASDVWQQQAVALVPSGFVAGRVYRLDLETMTGYLAAFPKGADTVEAPGSAFDPGYVVVARLRADGDRLAFVSGTFGRRAASDLPQDANEGYHKNIRDTVAATAKALLAGTTPCLIYGWSANADHKGLEVYAAPSGRATILGTLAPPYLPPDSEIAADDGWHAEFTIVGYQAGWFLIDDVQEPGAHYGEAARGLKPSYAGRGWVRTNEVMAAYANTQMPRGWLLQAPHIDAMPFVPEKAAADARLSIDGTLKRLFACSANWALTENTDGTRGWWRGTCSN